MRNLRCFCDFIFCVFKNFCFLSFYFLSNVMNVFFNEWNAMQWVSHPKLKIMHRPRCLGREWDKLMRRILRWVLGIWWRILGWAWWRVLFWMLRVVWWSCSLTTQAKYLMHVSHKRVYMLVVCLLDLSKGIKCFY